MRKSPGKWIKRVLLGKKTPKSNLSKAKACSESANEKTALVSTEAPAPDSTGDPPLTSPSVPDSGALIKHNSDLERETSPKLPGPVENLSFAKQSGAVQSITHLSLLEDSDRIRLEQAAIKAQASFRGYQARRAFRALKGIVRLQALVRGHLVRKQAVATLYCVLRIVELQALVRGQKFRHSNFVSAVIKNRSFGEQDAKCLDSCKKNTSIQGEKVPKHVFVWKLLSQSPVKKPLRLPYCQGEPNSAWEWLQRWTISRIWGPYSKSKKNIAPKNGGSRLIGTEQARPKRSLPRLPTSNVENGSNHPDSEKQKRNMKKVVNHPARSAPEHPPNEIEKAKRNLKKISCPVTESPVQLDVDSEKSKYNHKKSPKSAALNLSNQGPSGSAEKETKDDEETVPKPSDVEADSKLKATNESVIESHLCPTADEQPNNVHCEDEINLMANTEFSSKEDQNSNENQKNSSRRASLPGKHDYQENGQHSTLRIPSYMAATESAKAKLRGQISPKLGIDGNEKSGLTRRYSLPSYPNGKMNSPRMQRLVQASGKGGIRSDRSLMSSTDSNDKAIRVEWRR